MNTVKISLFGGMSLSALKSTIKRVIKEKKLTIGYVASKVGVSEKTLGDWLGKNQSMDVFDLKKISEAVELWWRTRRKAYPIQKYCRKA